MKEKILLRKIGKLNIYTLYHPFTPEKYPDLKVREYLKYIHIMLLNIEKGKISATSFEAIKIYIMIKEFVYLGYLYDKAYDDTDNKVSIQKTYNICFSKKERIACCKKSFFKTYKKMFVKYYKYIWDSDMDAKKLYMVSRNFDKYFIKKFLINTRKQ